MTRIVRLGVTIPPDLLNDFDRTIRKARYGNRSKAVQDAMRLFISERKLLQDEIGMYAGVLMMLFDHNVRELESILTHIQHHYTDVISSTLHIHLGEKGCLEVITVKGDIDKIRKLNDELMTEKGVKTSRTMLVSV